MVARGRLTALILGWLVMAATLCGQTSEHDDVEVIHPPPYNPSREKKPDLVSGSISTTTWQNANYPNDGQVLGSDW